MTKANCVSLDVISFTATDTYDPVVSTCKGNIVLDKSIESNWPVYSPWNGVVTKTLVDASVKLETL
jgi:hypothetical protein